MEILSKVEGLKIPLIIMTSKDTHQKTSELLEKNDNFGIQIEVIQQEEVPTFEDMQGNLSITPEGLIETKPHGHGDIH